MSKQAYIYGEGTNGGELPPDLEEALRQIKQMRPNKFFNEYLRPKAPEPRLPVQPPRQIQPKPIEKSPKMKEQPYKKLPRWIREKQFYPRFLGSKKGSSYG